MDILDLHFENFYILSNGVHHDFYALGFFSDWFIKPADSYELPAPVSNKALHLTPSTNITTTRRAASP